MCTCLNAFFNDSHMAHSFVNDDVMRLPDSHRKPCHVCIYMCSKWPKRSSTMYQTVENSHNFLAGSAIFRTFCLLCCCFYTALHVRFAIYVCFLCCNLLQLFLRQNDECLLWVFGKQAHISYDIVWNNDKKNSHTHFAVVFDAEKSRHFVATWIFCAYTQIYRKWEKRKCSTNSHTHIHDRMVLCCAQNVWCVM